MHLNACVDIILLFILKFWGICSKGVKVGEERWRELSDLCEEHTDDHVFGYYDAGFMMAFAQGGQDRCVSNMLESISNAIKLNKTPSLRSALKMHFLFSRTPGKDKTFWIFLGKVQHSSRGC